MSSADETVDLSQVVTDEAPKPVRKGGIKEGPEWTDFKDKEIHTIKANNPIAACIHCEEKINGKTVNKLVVHILECEKAPADRKEWYRELQEKKRESSASVLVDVPQHQNKKQKSESSGNRQQKMGEVQDQR